MGDMSHAQRTAQWRIALVALGGGNVVLGTFVFFEGLAPKHPPHPAKDRDPLLPSQCGQRSLVEPRKLHVAHRVRLLRGGKVMVTAPAVMGSVEKLWQVLTSILGRRTSDFNCAHLESWKKQTTRSWVYYHASGRDQQSPIEHVGRTPQVWPYKAWFRFVLLPSTPDTVGILAEIRQPRAKSVVATSRATNT